MLNALTVSDRQLQATYPRGNSSSLPHLSRFFRELTAVVRKYMYDLGISLQNVTILKVETLRDAWAIKMVTLCIKLVPLCKIPDNSLAVDLPEEVQPEDGSLQPRRQLSPEP